MFRQLLVISIMIFVSIATGCNGNGETKENLDYQTPPEDYTYLEETIHGDFITVTYQGQQPTKKL